MEVGYGRVRTLVIEELKQSFRCGFFRDEGFWDQGLARRRGKGARARW